MSTMRIGTWNVEYAFKNRLEVLRRVLALPRHRADIWVLTETHDDLAPPNLPHVAHSDERPANSPAIRPLSRWVSIWSKYPTKQICVPVADSRRTVCTLLDIGGAEELLVYGTVMPWHTDQGDTPPTGVKLSNWSEHHRVVPLQCSEWATIQRAHPQAKLCVAGDYNSDMGKGTRYGTREGIAALYDGLANCNLFCATAPGRVPDGLLPALPIDHISVPLAWAKSARVVAAWPAFKDVISDHSGLIVEVDIGV